ncbi:uncharacterized protein LOC128164141 [Crassostrea angulata]|uniref:uncharacterized protein LOC128164141 n=1 Tax=Magallana angulata TaxID=2784310 RepID=UPI0022B1048B|nr:uncharacterized protein LOC128164141 [Crassostrea angulata]
MWTNQYNPCLLKSWDANMDIQYVLDPFSCIVYIISYISKSEREMGMLLKQTKIEAAEGNLSAHDTIKRVGSAYLNHREVSAQEAVYRVCNLKMKESSRKVNFIPVGENPTRLSKPLGQITKNKKVKIGENDVNADDDNDDDDEENSLWMTNIVERSSLRWRSYCTPTIQFLQILLQLYFHKVKRCKKESTILRTNHEENHTSAVNKQLYSPLFEFKSFVSR